MTGSAFDEWSLEQLTRRVFLARGAKAAAAVPAAAALLAACQKPGQVPTTSTGGPGQGDYWPEGSPYPLARQDSPVTWDLWRDPIDSNLPVEKGATLKIFNWNAYLFKKVVEEFCAKYDCKYEITTYNGEDEALAKMRTGQLEFDVYFPSPDNLGKLVTAQLIQPLNHDYIPHLVSDVWPAFQNPWYDQEWRYTVPYVMYTTGIAYRRDFISDEQIQGMSNPYDILWDPKYKGDIGIYDSYREAIALALLRKGITDLNTGDQGALDQAQSDLVEMIDAVDVRLDTNGAYLGIPTGKFKLHQAWSGDIAAGWWYTPEQNMEGWKTLGYWYPDDRVGAVGNDNIVIPANAEHPVLAHKFIDWMMTETHSMLNFSWVGYQPPQNAADPKTLTTTDSFYDMPYVLPWLSRAVIEEKDFETGSFEAELTPEVDAIWHNAWQGFKAGVS